MAHRQAYYRDNTHLVDLANYLFFKEFADRDFTFVVNGDSIKVHKLVIKNTSEEFQSKFQLWEKANKKSVEVSLKPFGNDQISTRMFKLFIQYCYTGSLNWKEVDDSGLLDMLALCHEYGLFNLASVLCEGLEERKLMNIWNVWHFYQAANAYELQSLHDCCMKFIDRHAIETLSDKTCWTVSAELFKNVVSRDTLFAKEADILKGVLSYLLNTSQTVVETAKREILSTIRWSLITRRQFEEVVLPTKLADNEYFENSRVDKKDRERMHPDYPSSRV